jgi:chitinase
MRGIVVLLVLIVCAVAPRAVIYLDAINSWWPPTAIAAAMGVPGYAHNTSFNIINLSFWLNSGSADAALLWANVYTYVSSDNPWGSSNQAVQQAWVQRYHSAGIKIMVSAFGATEFPTSAGVDPVACGTSLANFVKQNNLDGVDLDWEDNSAMEAGTGEQWLITITKTLRNLLPKSQGYIISHAPQAPYFMGAPKYPKGGYLTVDKEVGSLIDFYNVQFYNQGTSTYDTYDTLFQSANGWATGTSVHQLISAGIPASRIVVGKPITTGDATNTGYVPVNQLAQYFSTARGTGWSTGFMGWQYKSDPDGSWSTRLAQAL